MSQRQKARHAYRLKTGLSSGSACREIWRQELLTIAPPEQCVNPSHHLEVRLVSLILSKNPLDWIGEYPYYTGEQRQWEPLLLGRALAWQGFFSEKIRKRSKGSSLRSSHTGFPGLRHLRRNLWMSQLVSDASCTTLKGMPIFLKGGLVHSDKGWHDASHCIYP